nr:reverse transcriptase domain-containing protein [Tanacetum cinerariifolium]
MEGYGEAIVIPEIFAENFEIKTNLLQLVQANKFYGRENDNPHTYISNFKRMTATLKYRDVLNDAIKLMLFSYSLDDRARIWDVVSKYDDRIDKLADRISNLVEIVNKQVIAPAKAVEKTCVTCGGAHAYYECIATDTNPSSVCAVTSSYNQVSPPNRASHQIPPPGFAPVQNNPNRFNQGQGNYFNQANNFNQGNNFKGNNFQNNQGYCAQMNNVPNFQNQSFQNQPFSVPNNQIPPSVPNEFLSYMKSNGIMIKSMQNQINVLRCDFNKQEENLRRNLNNDMRSILGSFFQNQPSTSGTLPSNIVPNPKGEMKAVTTRSGLAYEGPSIPTESPPEKVDEQKTKEILDKEHSNSSGSTAQVQPPVVPISIPEPDVPRTQSKLTIPYLSSLLANKDKLFELAKVPLNENCSAMLLKNLLEKLGDPGKFLIPYDFPEMEGGPFLRTGHALIDVYGEEITLRDVLDFQYNPKSSSPTLVSKDSISESDSCKEPIVKPSSPTLTPFGESDFFLKEIEDFLNDDSIPTGIENSVYDPEGDILFLEKMQNQGCSDGFFFYKNLTSQFLIKKGSENLAADHLSRLENPHQDMLENKDINENFPLETLGSLTSHSTPWFTDIVNFHAGNFIKKGLTSQQKKKFFKDIIQRCVHGQEAFEILKAFHEGPSGAIKVSISQRKMEKSLKEMRCLRTTAGDHRKLQLNELNELRDQACENSVIYKERTKKLHDSKIKNRIFNVGDQVLLFNSRLNIFSGKLKTRWSGPFTITVFFLTVPLSYLNLMIFTRSPWTTKFEDRVKLSDSVKKTSASWEAPHAYPFLSSFYFSNMSFEKGL